MRAAGQKDYTSLVRGLITEASPLSFPEGATTAELNFTIDRDGLIRKRRLGFEQIGLSNSLENNGTVQNVEYWRGPSVVCVIVVDETPQTLLRFHAVNTDFELLTEIPVADKSTRVQFAQTTNLLLLTTETGDNPLLCEYDEETEGINVSDVSIFIRDFDVIDDDLGVPQRPISLTQEHEYNLYNAGWYQTRPDADDNKIEKNVAQAFKDSTGQYPSNADVSSIGIIDDGDGNLVFDSEYVEQADFGNSIAPRGHYVYNIRDLARLTRVLSPFTDGTPNTTLTPVGSTGLGGTDTFNPDEGEDSGSGGGGIDPYVPGRGDIAPPGGEIP